MSNHEDTVPVDAALVAALYAEHADELQRFLTGVLRDSQLAADALQAAFVKMVEQGHHTREESRKAWLFRVAYHEALAVRRRQAVGEKAVRRLADELSDRDLFGASSEQPLVRMEQVEAVRAALELLPAAQQQVVRLRIYEEKKFAEIAAELAIPLSTALARMRAALAKLKQALEEHQ